MRHGRLPTTFNEARESAMSERPIRASKHCRHYSYEPGLQGGPRCARGCDQKSGTGPCMPPPYQKGECASREDYTDAERSAWEAEVQASMVRLGKAVEVLPHPIPLRTDGTAPCPNCSGTLHYSRWHRGASLQC